MATLIHLDTHVVAWLFAGEVDRLARGVRRKIDEDQIAISPAVELELQFLFEIGRTDQPGRQVVADLVERIGLTIAQTPFARVVASAAALSWTRDPFDRLIVGHAMADRAVLLTRDRAIRKHYREAVWG